GGRSAPIAAGEAISTPLATSQKWLDALRLIGRELPFELCNWQINQFADFDIKRIYRSGEIQATCSFRGQVLEVFVDCSGNRPPAGCSCPESLGETFCSHTFVYVQYLIKQLENEGSRLNWLLEQGSFTDAVPNRERFKPDLDLQSLARL